MVLCVACFGVSFCTVSTFYVSIFVVALGFYEPSTHFGSFGVIFVVALGFYEPSTQYGSYLAWSVILTTLPEAVC